MRNPAHLHTLLLYMYNKDMGETGTKFQHWRDRMVEKYHRERDKGDNRKINFDSCENDIWEVKGY